MTQPGSFVDFGMTPAQLAAFAAGQKKRTPTPNFYEDGTPINPPPPAPVHTQAPPVGVAPRPGFGPAAGPALPNYMAEPFAQIQQRNEDAKVSQMGPVEEGNDFTVESGKRSLGENAGDELLRPQPIMGPMGPQGQPMYGYLPLKLGPEGFKSYQEATDPKPMMKALDNEAAVAQKEGDATAAAYKAQREGVSNELAAIRERRMKNEAAIQQKLAEYDAASQRYSNDLADTGKFWRNPGNIIASIGSIFTVLGGGHSTIDAAIAHDFMARKTAADMRLGAMRSNIDQYRQLFNDKEQGDMWALGESYRVGAMQLKEIGDQFQGPRAAAIRDKAFADLMQKSAMLKMEVARRMEIQPQLMPQWQANLINKASQAYPKSGYQDYTKPPKPGTLGAIGEGAAAEPSTAQQPTAASGASRGDLVADQFRYGGDPDKTGYKADRMAMNRGVQSDAQVLPAAEEKTTSTTDKAAKALVKGNGQIAQKLDQSVRTKALRGAVDERIPGISERIERYKERVMSRALVKAGRKANDPFKVNEEWDKIIDQDNAAADKVAASGYEKSYQNAMGWARFKEEINLVKAAIRDHNKATGDHMSEDDFRGLRAIDFPFANEIQKYRQLMASPGASPEAAQRLKELQAAERFHQMIATKTTAFYHNMIGGNQSEGERKLIEQVIDPNANFSKIEGFADGMLEESGRTANVLFGQAGEGAKILLELRYGPNVGLKMNTRGYKPSR